MSEKTVRDMTNREQSPETCPRRPDTAVLCLPPGAPEAGKENEIPMKEITLDAVVDNVSVITAFADAELEAAGCPLKAMMQIDVIIDEIFANIAMYAYAPGTGRAVFGISVDSGAKTVTLRFSDSGVPFNPLTREDPDIRLGPEEREAGGLGIFMVKKMTDDISYEYRNGRNILTVRKSYS